MNMSIRQELISKLTEVHTTNEESSVGILATTKQKTGMKQFSVVFQTENNFRIVDPVVGMPSYAIVNIKDT